MISGVGLGQKSSENEYKIYVLASTYIFQERSVICNKNTIPNHWTLYKGYAVCVHVLVKLQLDSFIVPFLLHSTFLRIWKQFIFLKDIKEPKSPSNLMSQIVLRTCRKTIKDELFDELCIQVKTHAYTHHRTH